MHHMKKGAGLLLLISKVFKRGSSVTKCDRATLCLYDLHICRSSHGYRERLLRLYAKILCK